MLHRVLHAFASDCARCVRCGFVMTRFSGTTAATAGATAWMCPPLSGTSRLPFSFPAASAAPPPARALPPARVAVVTSQLGRKPACNPVVSCPRPSSSGTTRCRTTWAEPTPAKTAAGATSSCLPASAFTVSRKGRSFQFSYLQGIGQKDQAIRVKGKYLQSSPANTEISRLGQLPSGPAHIGKHSCGNARPLWFFCYNPGSDEHGPRSASGKMR